MIKHSKASDFDDESIRGLSVSRDFKHAHPELLKRMQEAIAAYARMFPNRQVIVTCTYRSPDVQRELFKQGRFGDRRPIITNCDGSTKKSQHNYFPSRAVDVAVADGGKIYYDEAMLYPLGNLAKECGLEWGGFWTGGFVDPPHFQLPKDVV